MAEENPTRNEINLIFKTLMNIPTNKSCFDCKTKNPTWSSVTYGVLICIDCAAVHRSLGVHLSFVRSTQLDDNWSWQQLRQMQLGGNANAQSFFETHDCRTTDAQQKYNSRAAQLYREKLANAARNAQRKYGRSPFLPGSVDPTRPSSVLTGTVLHLDSSAAVVTNEKSEKEKEFDFFEEHSNNNSGFESQFKTSQTINSAASLNGARISSRAKLSSNEDSTARVATSGSALGAGSGPSIDALLSAPSTQPDVTRKPTIGTRKPQPKRTGLGAKKTGLGAERVKANFAEIEREAELADQLKMQEAEKKTVSPELNKEEEEAQLASMRLAYQDLSIKQKKEEDKLKAVDPKKAQQIERLGMGFASRSGVSHSAISDMKTIEQETPANSSNKSKRSSLMDSDTDNYFDDFNFVTTSSSGFSMYKGSSNSSPPDRGNQSGLDSMMFLDHYNCSSSSSSSNNPSSSSNNLSSSSTTTSSRNQANKGGGGGGGGGWWEPQPMSAAITSPADNHNNNSSSSGYSSSNRNSSRGGREAPTSTSGSNSPAGSDAQKKFGAAKAISSKQYFGDSNDSTWERKSNLSRFEGSTSISSADYFGRAETIPGGGGVGGAGGIQTPDLDDVKESVRQGVTKVAGRLSSMANGFMSSLSDKYSGY